MSQPISLAVSVHSMRLAICCCLLFGIVLFVLNRTELRGRKGETAKNRFLLLLLLKFHCQLSKYVPGRKYSSHAHTHTSHIKQ